jgi:hypothetical protein
VFVAAPNHPFFANDSHAYWAVNRDSMYANGFAPAKDAFVHTPPVGILSNTFDAVGFDASLGA